jgi:hypothetical protein
MLEIGSLIPGEYARYTNIDVKTKPGAGHVHEDGTPYPKMTRRGPASASPRLLKRLLNHCLGNK